MSFLFWSIACAGICYWIARKKNRNKNLWAVIGFFSLLFGVLIISLLPRAKREENTRNELVGESLNPQYKNSNLNWEQLSNDYSKIQRGLKWHTYRAKVLGGWLVFTQEWHGDKQNIAFYPDPEHQWDGNSLP